MFNPNEHLERCESYMSRFLGSAVKLIHAEALQQSTREVPWRLDVRMDGVDRAFVLQVDPSGMEYEYQILKAVESIPVPTPRAYGLDMQGEALGVPCFFSDFIEGESLLGLMLAGKLHMILQKPCFKGRDLYDMMWYLIDREWPAPNLDLVNNALKQTGWLGETLSLQTWHKVVRKKIESTPWEQAIDDVRPFIASPDDLELLTRENLLNLLK